MIKFVDDELHNYKLRNFVPYVIIVIIKFAPDPHKCLKTKAKGGHVIP